MRKTTLYKLDSGIELCVIVGKDKHLAINQPRESITVSGRYLTESDSKFPFQSVTESIKAVIINDVSKDFSLKAFIENLVANKGLKVERKHKGSFISTAKIFITASSDINIDFNMIG